MCSAPSPTAAGNQLLRPPPCRADHQRGAANQVLEGRDRLLGHRDDVRQSRLLFQDPVIQPAVVGARGDRSAPAHAHLADAVVVRDRHGRLHGVAAFALAPEHDLPLADDGGDDALSVVIEVVDLLNRPALLVDLRNPALTDVDRRDSRACSDRIAACTGPASAPRVRHRCRRRCGRRARCADEERMDVPGVRPGMGTTCATLPSFRLRNFSVPSGSTEPR